MIFFDIDKVFYFIYDRKIPFGTSNNNLQVLQGVCCFCTNVNHDLALQIGHYRAGDMSPLQSSKGLSMMVFGGLESVYTLSPLI